MTERWTGVDLGGSKISAVVLDEHGREHARQRIATPRGDYQATLAAIADIITAVETQAGLAANTAAVGIGTPGSPLPQTGRMQNANSVWLNEKPLRRDLEGLLGRPVVLANDANCLALSEATDGAAAGVRIVFAAILGTGVGGGIVIDGALLNGPLGIAGEWGHTPLPAPSGDEIPGPKCWCGRSGCIEAWLSGPGLARDHLAATGEDLTADAIASGDTPQRAATMARYTDRLARALSVIVNIIDPHVIVLGGGLSNIPRLYDELPQRIRPHLFSDLPQARILPARHGDDSGVRGAARLAKALVA